MSLYIVGGACGGYGWRSGATLAYGHAVLLLEVGRIDLEIVEEHRFVGHLLFGCVVGGVVPAEAGAGDGEPVAGHSRDKLVVDHVADKVAVGLDEILEDLQVGL